jgi:hypothetical protein
LENVDRLTGEVTTLTVEQHDTEKVLALASGRLAADILDGHPVDREELSKAEAKAATIVKLLAATQVALRLAKTHHTEVKEAQWTTQQEIQRVESTGHRQAAIKAITSALESFKSAGRPVASFDRLVTEMATGGGIEAVLKKDA